VGNCSRRGVLTLTATILYSISTRHIPSNVNIRVDVAILSPLLLVAWLERIGLTTFAVVKKPRRTGFFHDDDLRKE
jgi:hypothetical protein